MGTGAAAGVTRTIRAEAADSPPGTGRLAPVNSRSDFSHPHNLIKIQYFFTKILPHHHIDIPNSFTKPKT
jgi:hypothetical protein